MSTQSTRTQCNDMDYSCGTLLVPRDPQDHHLMVIWNCDLDRAYFSNNMLDETCLRGHHIADTTTGAQRSNLYEVVSRRRCGDCDVRESLPNMRRPSGTGCQHGGWVDLSYIKKLYTPAPSTLYALYLPPTATELIELNQFQRELLQKGTT